MAAVAVAISAGGALSSFQTTALLTVEETMTALEKARSIILLQQQPADVPIRRGETI
jgi:hypothetical protein